MTGHDRFAVELREQMRELRIRRFGLSPAVLDRALGGRSARVRKAGPAAAGWRESGLIVR